MGTRKDGRDLTEIRPVKITKHFIKYPEGSVLYEQGETKVIITVSVDERVPHWMLEAQEGWVTAEYNMLPRATHTRTQRPREGHINTRNIELSRLVGRALRPVVDMKALGPRTLRVDCDVIQADGGTRCASITGACVALKLAERWLIKEGHLVDPFMVNTVAAISVGIMGSDILLDLNYAEDKDVGVDLNVIMNANLQIIEIQGTAEHQPVSRSVFNQMVDVAEKGLKELFSIQAKVL